VPGTKDGLSFTAQAGNPEAASPFTSRPFTYRGCKVSQWELSCNDGQLVQLKLTVDGWREDTATALVSPAYAGASYQPGIFSFADVSTFTLGGTPSTTAGVTSVAAGVSVATVCKGITLTGQTPLAGDRFGLGNAGTKREQLQNGIPTISGTLNAEFTSRAEFYDLFTANTTTAMQIDWAHGDAGTTNPYRLSIILPAVKFKMADVKLNGADILQQDIQFEAYDDGSGTNPPIQVRLVSQDQLI
jgi:Phage tail tube protein